MMPPVVRLPLPVIHYPGGKNNYPACTNDQGGNKNDYSP